MKKKLIYLLLITFKLGAQNVTSVSTPTGVGIGTSSPQAYLHVYRNATTGSWGSLTTANAGIKVQDNFASLYIDGNSLYSNKNMNIGTSTNNVLSFGTNNIERIHIKKDGNVGIGTIPNAKFHVKKQFSTGKKSQYSIAIIEAGSAHLDLISDGSNKWGSSINFIEGVNSGAGNNKDIWSITRQTTAGTGNSSLCFNFGQTNSHLNDNKVSFFSDGNVGIGVTDTKGYKLGVNGKIAATEVKIALFEEWSDFVFYDNYNLPTLEDVEKYINEKGHLKDIPSAKEVSENGFYLGKMNSKLLQKIEELMLYTITQDKELKTQNLKIIELQKRLENLELK